MGSERSSALMRRATERIPGGVNSPVRAFGAVGGTPRFVASADGAWVTDVDGERYVDYVASWGAVIHGHAHPAIVEAVRDAAGRGLSFGAPTEAEVVMAERICALVPSCEMVRLVNSGTEATMSALRLARGATGRAKLVKFEGCYHGHADALLAAAGSGVATFGIPGTQGVPEAAVADTLIVAYNDLEGVSTAFERYPDDIAAVILEPIAGNMGFVRPTPEFLTGLRALCDEHGALLVVDEVMTGFRVALGGAQTLLGIEPDLSTFGKVIGGGLPVGAYGGRREWMEQIAPVGGVYQAGTLSGNPLATAAGLAALDLLESDRDFYSACERRARAIIAGWAEAAAAAGVPFSGDACGAMWGIALADRMPADYAEAGKSDHDRYARLFHALLDEGVYLAPSGYEAAFVTGAHGDAEIDHTLEAGRRALARLA